MNWTGLREFSLQRNRLGPKFAAGLVQTLGKDKYLKVLNISGNYIDQHDLSSIVKNALTVNRSLVGFDARLNPGCTEKIEK